jgi:deazaflavin-dependent oxidoreductase (nitroreductase family)
MNQELSQIEASFFRTLNQFAEPLIRAGFGNPVLWPTGAIVLETVGRNSGRKYNVPLLATRVGDMLVVGTVRRRSQWLKNLAANPSARYWMRGWPHEATAFVIAPGIASTPLDRLPSRARWLVNALTRQSNLFGIGFAILVPPKHQTKVV